MTKQEYIELASLAVINLNTDEPAEWEDYNFLEPADKFYGEEIAKAALDATGLIDEVERLEGVNKKWVQKAYEDSSIKAELKIENTKLKEQNDKLVEALEGFVDMKHVSLPDGEGTKAFLAYDDAHAEEIKQKIKPLTKYPAAISIHCESYFKDSNPIATAKQALANHKGAE